MADDATVEARADDRGTCPQCGEKIRRDGWAKHWAKQHPKASPTTFTTNPLVVVPRLCRRHEFDLVSRKLRIPESGPWLVALVNATILLFQWAVVDRRVVARTGSDAEMLSLVLNEIGCLACYDHEGYRRMVLVQKKGLSHAAQVAQHKATDPDWPIEARAAAAKEGAA